MCSQIDGTIWEHLPAYGLKSLDNDDRTVPCRDEAGELNERWKCGGLFMNCTVGSGVWGLIWGVSAEGWGALDGDGVFPGVTADG